MHTKKIIISALLLLFVGFSSYAGIDARMFRHPDVSKTQITFVYAGDVWVVSKTGGLATKLSSPKGPEAYPRFSPDGKQIAFSGNYEGNADVYVISTEGGLPHRVTSHGYTDKVIGWHPDGKQILFSSMRETGRQRFNQFYVIDAKGGIAKQLPMPYAEYGSFSPDGKSVAFTQLSRHSRSWKRYRGGMAPDIWTLNLTNNKSNKLVDNDANNEFPMWIKDKVYYLSDQGKNKRFNLWVTDAKTNTSKQLTFFEDFDIHYPAEGPEDIVFEAGGKLYLFNLEKGKAEEVKVEVVTDQLSLLPKQKNVAGNIQNLSIAPDGKRVLVQARGEILSVPAEHGYIKNLTNTTGAAERYPAWSPNGRYVAYWSDATGEYELTVIDFENGGQSKTISKYGEGYRYQIFWSPDSKKLVFIDQEQNIMLYNMKDNLTQVIDHCDWMNHYTMKGFKVDWSADSNFVTYSREVNQRTQRIFLYDVQNKFLQQLTSGFYNDYNPVFDPSGKYLYFLTQRHFSPMYSNPGYGWIYNNSTQIAVATLRHDLDSPFTVRNDEVEIVKDKEDSKKAKKEEKKADKKKSDKGEDKNVKENGDNGKNGDEPWKIEAWNFEDRIELFPMKPGRYGQLGAVKGKMIFMQYPRAGAANGQSQLKYYDLKAREEKTILNDLGGYSLSANKKKMLVGKGRTYAIINVAPNQKMDKKLNLSNLDITVDPKAEWKQIFADAWRIERDFFYDPNMHGVDWEAMKNRYGKLVDDAVTRDDINYVIGELIGELNASHAYRSGGDLEYGSRKSVGYLGINWKFENGHYRIGKILKGATWDVEARSPLSKPGLKVKEGDYIFAVNGRMLEAGKEPYVAFEGLSGKTVELLVGSTPSIKDAKTISVKTMKDENRLRHLAWIESKRSYIDKQSNGKIGYIYVRSTGIDGQNELVRQFLGQYDKEALVIDERFNSGGQIPDRFVELLNRKAFAYWTSRGGTDRQWPPVGHFGPKAMLINGWSGSGGDAFPDFFRKAGLGPLIGERTWGGLIGISGAPGLIDGGSVTVPTFRMYHPDGEYFKEGHGVDPDIEVVDDPGMQANGIDPQLNKALEYLKEQLKTNPYKKPHSGEIEKR
ncbi:peptidase S41 [Puteibacter caeruleilacunae]|nr:peptidase S41 [Puteibacter caeruleilacunae]